MIRGISEDILRRVYDFSEMTNEELRCKFFQKLQECIELCNNTNDILEWLKNEGLGEEVNELLTVWLEDGTLAKLINDDLFNELKTELLDKINQNKNDIDNSVNTFTKQIENTENQIRNNYKEAFNQIRTNTSYRLYSSPVLTIIVDDGNDEFLSLVKPVLDSYGIRASMAVIPEKVGTDGYMTLEQLKELQSNGYSILSHSFTHSQNIYKPGIVDNNPISDDVILEDYRKCYEFMVNNNFNGADTIVYPWGYFTDSGRYKNLARTYYNNGVNAYGGSTDSYNVYGNGVNGEINDNMYLNRLFINKNTNIQAYKNAIDYACSTGGWLILGIHSNTNEIDISHLRSIIDYVRVNSMMILPFNEANRLKGNAINIGDYTNPYKFFVSKRGNTSDSNFTVNVEDGYKIAVSNIKNSNNIVNGYIRLQNDTGTGVFTNQLKLATISNLKGLTGAMILPCVVTTWDSKVISGACSLNASGNNIVVNCHGGLENSNIWRIDLNFSFIV